MIKKLIVSVGIVLGIVTVTLAQPRRVLQLIDGHLLDTSSEMTITNSDQRHQTLNLNNHQEDSVKLSVGNENENKQNHLKQHQQQDQQTQQNLQQQNNLIADNVLSPGAPIGPDGQVIDTPAVAIAKAEHIAAHVNQKVILAKELARNAAATSGTILVAIAPTPVFAADVVLNLVCQREEASYLAVAGESMTNKVVLEYQDSIGQYSFGYSAPESARSEIRSADGFTRGAFSYVDDAGVIQTAKYTADSVNGFRIQASNLPQPPNPVEDTPEVQAARLEHFRAHEAALKNNKVQNLQESVLIDKKNYGNIITTPKMIFNDKKNMNDVIIEKHSSISQLNDPITNQPTNQMDLKQKVKQEISLVKTSFTLPKSNVDIQNRIELRAMDLSTSRAPLKSLSQDKTAEIPMEMMVQSQMMNGNPMTVMLRYIQTFPTVHTNSEYFYFVPSYYF
ncbi:hypothetical protein PV327_004723 [Microctonus hyperodae]|uniref:Cuticle protein 6 n=1 Tax=Microctonus hyperodae TaxID=165561 RepID=A0AA39KN05_MICHY|nr:hypothetical protein PV327_004723 [Microctonus hyperodae]